MVKIDSFERMQDSMNSEGLVLFYLSRPGCGVCSALKPKVMAMMELEFPDIAAFEVDLDEVPEAGGQLSVFAIPAVLVYSGGRELIREARYFSVDELAAKIRRPYSFLQEEGGGL